VEKSNSTGFPQGGLAAIERKMAPLRFGLDSLKRSPDSAEISGPISVGEAMRKTVVGLQSDAANLAELQWAVPR
jgi:hypothetical protein